MPTIQTVTRTIPTAAVTLADAHTHAWIMPPDNVSDTARLELHDFDKISAELTAFKAAGGSLIVDCQPGGAGRDSNQLRQLSQQTSVHITTTTGAHQHKYYNPDHWLWSATVEQATEFYIAELTLGTEESIQQDENNPILATTIKVGYEGTIDGQTAILMQAAAHASNQTGALILFHTERGANIEALPPFFADLRVPMHRLYLCHVDKRPDFALHKELIQAGILLGYDTFNRPKYNPDENVWPLLQQIREAGLSHGIAIGLDMALNEMWQTYNGEPGILHITQTIIPHMQTLGFDAATIHQLTAGNIARHLAR